tara:strand:+ start:31211 stop:31732 length:522 start_codon:yes stop_codon:yes gene_type:complete
MITTTAFAQSKKEFTRKGFVFGVGMGTGVHLVDGEAHNRFTTPNIKIGAMLNPKLAILLTAPGGTHKQDEEVRAFEGVIPSVQYWISDQFYINAGVGLAIETTPFYKVNYSEGTPEFNTGIGLTSSIGYELVQWSTNKTLDAQLRVLYGNIEFDNQSNTENLAIDLVIGFNLY